MEDGHVRYIAIVMSIGVLTMDKLVAALRLTGATIVDAKLTAASERHLKPPDPLSFDLLSFDARFLLSKSLVVASTDIVCEAAILQQLP